MENSLGEYIDNLPIVSTHEHHQPFELSEPATLEYLMNSGYVGWCGVKLDGREDRERFLELIAVNSYFVWYERALDDLFDFGGYITQANWDDISAKTASALSLPGYHEMVFREKCRYRRAILDAYWEPGSNNGRPDLYSPTLRINSFVYGRTLHTRDHNGNNAQMLYGQCHDLDEYLALIESCIVRAKSAGAVALKSALAYDRHLNFLPRDKAEAAHAFNLPECTLEEEIVFQDFIYDYICKLAAKYDLSFQNHVGLGQLGGSNPLNLIPMIERHPETKFVLFHMGYPWVREVCALTHNYANVYADLCWLPSISTSAAIDALHELMEAARDASRVCWGGDCWLVTESYGASLAIRWCLKQVLLEKIEAGYLTEQRAREWAKRILWRNAENLYRL